ncbi:MAG: hypothetical protein NT062_02360 [Proteobacteria bacterium]|nr:hypothetical protein [Pseudomonadota bacterium]
MGRHVAIAMAIALLSTTACQPLYGSKPDKLAKPSPKKRPPEEKVVAPEVKYVEDCTPNFRDDPKNVRQEKAISNRLVADGDAAMDAGRKAKEPPAQASAFKEAIDKYSNALRKDPYNASATIQLAIAYDAVYRKGCALAMLKRLDALTKNPKVSPDATRQVDTISDNASLFKGYRKDAIAAVGR